MGIYEWIIKVLTYREKKKRKNNPQISFFKWCVNQFCYYNKYLKSLVYEDRRFTLVYNFIDFSPWFTGPATLGLWCITSWEHVIEQNHSSLWLGSDSSPKDLLLGPSSSKFLLPFKSTKLGTKSLTHRPLGDI